MLAARAQTTPAQPRSQDPLNRETPQSTVLSFLETARAGNFDRAWRYLDLQKLPPEQRLKSGPTLARQLEQILDRDVQFDVAALSRDPEGDREDGLPANREHVDFFNANGRFLDLQLERVSWRSGLSVWVFSADSVAFVPQIAQITSESPIERRLPHALVTVKLADTALWRWIAIVLLVAALAALSRLLASFILFLTELVVRRLRPRTDRGVFAPLGGPLRLLLTAAGLRVGMNWIGSSELVSRYVNHAVTLLLFFGVAWLCGRMIELAVGHLAATLGSKHRISYSVLPLASRVVKITIFFLAAAAVLSDWGYNTTTILAGLGVGGLAVALAAQKTIENLFGGVAVISDRPVYVGDVCRFGDRVGTVEDIGLRSTRIRTLDRTLITVPNAEFSAMTLENFSKRDKMLFHLTLNLRRDTTPDQVRTVLAAITRIVTENPKVQEGGLPVRFIGVGAYSLDIEVFVYILTQEGDEYLQIQQDLLLGLLDAVAAAGAALALPTQASIDYSTRSVPSPDATPSAEQQVG